MSLAQFSLAETPLSQGQQAAARIKVPPKRLTVAVPSATLVPEPR